MEIKNPVKMTTWRITRLRLVQRGDKSAARGKVEMAASCQPVREISAN